MNRSKFISILLVVACSFAVSEGVSTAESAGHLLEVVTYPSALSLKNGTGAYFGGDAWTGSGDRMASRAFQIFDPKNKDWRAGTPMSVARIAPSAVELNDGRILVTGGNTDDTHALNSTEIYDPITQTWAPGPPMHGARSMHASLVLKNGKVIVGPCTRPGTYAYNCGEDSKMEIFDPAKPAWENPTEISGGVQQMFELSDGRVLLHDWRCEDAVFDPHSGTSTLVPSCYDYDTSNIGYAGQLKDGSVILVKKEVIRRFNPTANHWEDWKSVALPKGFISPGLGSNEILREREDGSIVLFGLLYVLRSYQGTPVNLAPSGAILRPGSMEWVEFGRGEYTSMPDIKPVMLGDSTLVYKPADDFYTEVISF